MGHPFVAALPVTARSPAAAQPDKIGVLGRNRGVPRGHQAVLNSRDHSLATLIRPGQCAAATSSVSTSATGVSTGTVTAGNDNSEVNGTSEGNADAGMDPKRKWRPAHHRKVNLGLGQRMVSLGEGQVNAGSTESNADSWAIGRCGQRVSRELPCAMVRGRGEGQSVHRDYGQPPAGAHSP